MKPTDHLRFIERDKDEVLGTLPDGSILSRVTKRGILQQRWEESCGDEVLEEWRDVPLVDAALSGKE